MATDVRQLEQHTIAGYHIGERLGAGSSGVVYRAVQLSMQREVAFKAIDPALTASPEHNDQFVHEAAAAGAVQHANVATCFDAGYENGVVYLAQELMLGGSLADYLTQNGPILPTDEALGIAIDCARGVEGIHTAGLIHADIKPSNILISDNESIKLADLGLARFTSLDDAWASNRGDRPLADIAFAAPETRELSADQIDHRADTYAVGAVLFTMLTGQLPIGMDEGQAWGLDPSERDPRVTNPDVSDAVAAVVLKATDPAQANRYQDPAHLREDLERVAYQFQPLHATMTDAAGSMSSADHVVPDALPTTNADLSANALTRDHHAGQSSGVVTAPTAATPAPPAPAVAPAAPAAAPQKNGPGIGMILVVLILVGGAIAVAVIMTQQPATPATNTSANAETPAPAIADPTPAADNQPSLPKPTGPSWATAFGSDDFGDWASATIAGVDVRFRKVPAGQLRMGDGLANEAPHQVTISKDFWLAEHETTQALYQAVTGSNPSKFPAADQPVESVTWLDVTDFIARVRTQHPELRLRLPSEAEWELAARGGRSANPAPAANEAWTSATAERRTHAVGEMAANPFGLYDMAGNVMEWVADAFAPYQAMTATDPVVEEGIHRVARGGSWSLQPEACGPANRYHYQPASAFFFLGFRLAISD